MILSICIPTYNRASFLKQCLQSIVSQFQNETVRSQVEIVISDNGSTDNTQEIIQEFASRFSNIVSIKNSDNIGFDRNVLAVVGSAHGTYCWLLGDDDALFEDALKKYLPRLQKAEAAYYMVNCLGYDHSLIAPSVSNPNLHIEKDMYYRMLQDFVRSITDMNDIVGYFGGMSVQVFSRSVWNKCMDKEQWIGTQTIHLFVLLSAYRELAFQQIAEPFVKTRSDNMRWDTFTGLETLTKRAYSTYKTRVWILDLYSMPYSITFLKVHLYSSLASNWFVNAIKKYFLSNPAVRAFVVPKLKAIVGR